MQHTDVLVVGHGLAGMVAALEALDRGRRVTLIDQEGPQSLGGQAFWSLGGLFLVGTPEQRRMGIRDSRDLAAQDWAGSAAFDRPEDANPRAWAAAYLDFAAGEKRSWLRDRGFRFFPVPGWAERGGGLATGHGNSVPRFHIAWGAGEGIVAPFAARVRDAAAAGRLTYLPRHRLTALTVEAGAITGAEGDILAEDTARRGAPTSRTATGSFAIRAESTILATGGIGGDLARVRAAWPEARLGRPPRFMVAGVPAYVDGSGHDIATTAGAAAINMDRMWHYTEGLRNWDPIWPNHGIRILPGPSSLWLDATGARLPAPCFPGFDTLATLRRILATGHDHSWFVLTQKIIEKEFALSGSEQNPDLVSGRWSEVLKERLSKGATRAVEAFKTKGADFVTASDLDTLVAGMNRLEPDTPLDAAKVRAEVEARDREILNPFTKDAQITALRGARNYRGDRLIRTARPHRLLDAAAGPLIAVRLNILTRKSLGGLHTDLSSRVLRPDGSLLPGLYAAGEAAGFGGGGVHGYNALEGTFLGGCLFSGRIAGRAA